MSLTHDHSHTSTHASAAGSRWWNLLLVIPFVALLWVPFYNRLEPSVFGIPFFYWYQFLWVPLTSLIILLVHHMTAPADGANGGARDHGAHDHGVLPPSGPRAPGGRP